MYSFFRYFDKKFDIGDYYDVKDDDEKVGYDGNGYTLRLITMQHKVSKTRHILPYVRKRSKRTRLNVHLT